MNLETEALGPPYGPVSNLRDVFNTWRDRSMPEEVDRAWLERIGISSNLTAKNIHALRFLGLIDENGYTTQAAGRLRTATSEEYPQVLEEIIRKAYRKIFEVRNPSQDSRIRIDDAFRQEQPQAQRSRMVACFLGLCALALIPLKEAPPIIRESRKSTMTRPPRPVTTQERPKVTEPPPLVPEQRPQIRHGLFDPVLGGLIQALTEVKSVEELDEWYLVFKAAFGFMNNRQARLKSEAGD